MSDFSWVGDRTIVYNGRVIELTSNDGWEIINALKQVDEEQRQWREQNTVTQKNADDQTGIEKAMESIAIDMHKQTRLLQELIMTLEKMRKGQK